MENIIVISKPDLEKMIYDGVMNVLSKLKLNNEKLEEDELITRDEAAKLLDVDYSTLYRWKMRGWINPRHMGKRVYFFKKEILSRLK